MLEEEEEAELEWEEELEEEEDNDKGWKELLLFETLLLRLVVLGETAKDTKEDDLECGWFDPAPDPPL